MVQFRKCHSSGTVKDETTKIFPESSNAFHHLFRRNLADYFLRVPFSDFDDNVVATLIVAKRHVLIQELGDSIGKSPFLRESLTALPLACLCGRVWFVWARRRRSGMR